MELKPTQERIEAMVQRLARQPVLFARMEALLSARAESLDEAEATVVEHVRALGREVLHGWARAAAATAPTPAGARRGAKKNCAP